MAPTVQGVTSPGPAMPPPDRLSSPADPAVPAILTPEEARVQRRRELTMFGVLAVAIWPFLAVAIVGGYGFLVWMIRIVTGPPGPPSV